MAQPFGGIGLSSCYHLVVQAIRVAIVDNLLISASGRPYLCLSDFAILAKAVPSGGACETIRALAFSARLITCDAEACYSKSPAAGTNKRITGYQ